MAAFDRDDLERVDWALFQNGWVVKYWKPEVLESDVGWLAEHGYRVHRLDCARWGAADDALRELGIALGFPDYYGRNLDALDDCLGEIDVPAEGGVALVLQRYDRFAKVDRKCAQALLDVVAENARGFMLFGLRLVTLVQSEDPRLELDLVGATPVMWNRREWLDEKRGV